jgi:hypothetical protein
MAVDFDGLAFFMWPQTSLELARSVTRIRTSVQVTMDTHFAGTDDGA